MAELSIEKIISKTDSVLGTYTISRTAEKENPLIPYRWLNLVEDDEPPDIEGLDENLRHQDWYSSAKYVAYLADKRNRAVEHLLGMYPEITDIMCLDSYYLSQADAVNRLTADYYLAGRNMVLGGTVWGKIRTRAEDILRPRIGWFDKWGVPELQFLPYGWDPRKDLTTFRMRVPLDGFYRTHSVPGVHIFPRSAWENGARYGLPDDLHTCEHGFLCEESHLPSYVDFNAQFWRERSYSILHCIRNSLHAGRLLKLFPIYQEEHRSIEWTP